MRSSPINLNYPGDVVVNVGETEPLLEDYISDLDDASDIEVVVDHASQAEAGWENVVAQQPQKLKHRNYLYQDIEVCLAILREIQDVSIPASQRPYARKIKIYSTIALLFSISAIVTPGYFVKQLVENGLWKSQETIDRLRPLEH